MLYLAGIVITFFLAVLLWTKKGKTTGDKILATWLCVMGFHSFLFYLHTTDQIYRYPYLLGLHLPLPLLHGPLLYLYVLAETRFDGIKRSWWLHFVPAVLGYGGLYQFLSLPYAEKVSVYQHNGEGFEWFMQSILIALTISGFTYVLLSLYELKEYKKKIADRYSNTEKINLNWLRYLIYGILAIWLIIAFRGDDRIIFGAVVIFILFLGYFGIKHVGIFSYQQSLPVTSGPVTIEQAFVQSSPVETPLPQKEKRSLPLSEQAPGESRTKYERSSLQPEAATQIHTTLKKLMQAQKTFTDAELSLDSLATLLQVQPNTLSQVINTCEDKNFYDYINTLRIEEFKRRVTLPEYQHFTLLALAFDCGFNSKTSFNRNFRKITGQSPTEYLKGMKIQLQEQ
jgi:AraC-like DNA-binding protein